MFRTAFIIIAMLAQAPFGVEGQAVGHRIPINGMQLYYEVSGEGDPLIVLHGAYMSIPAMGPIIQRSGWLRV